MNQGKKKAPPVLHVLLIHNFYRDRGGEDSVFDNELQALQDAGVNTITYTRHSTEIDNFSRKQKVMLFRDGYRNRQTEQDLEEIILSNRIDIAHVHNVFPLLSPSVYRVLKKHSIPVVQTLHNYRFLCANAVFYHHGKNCQKCLTRSRWNCVTEKCFRDSYLYSFWYTSIINKNIKVIRGAIDGYIALTGFTRDIFLGQGFEAEKFHVKPNGFFRPESGREDDGGYFLYLGRISEEKGIEFLLESCAERHDIQLVVAGDGPLLPVLRERYKNAPGITFSGFVSGHQKEDLVNKATALIVPSTCHDNFPVSLVEAFSRGIPVVGSRIGGIPHIISDDKNGLIFSPGSGDELLQHLDSFTRDPSLRKRLGDQARDHFNKEMEFSRNIEHLLDIYKEVKNAK
jgi:glycosyltransferase involved in cell wall biosynthesis